MALSLTKLLVIYKLQKILRLLSLAMLSHSEVDVIVS